MRKASIMAADRGSGKLSKAQWEALSELSTIDGDGWIKTRWLSGSTECRSAKNLKSLVVARMVESKRWRARSMMPRPYIWRITPAGLAAVASHTKEG